MVEKNFYTRLSNLNIAVVSHIFATGPTQELVNYLKDKVNILVFIGHPLFRNQRQRSFFKKYKRGKELHYREFALPLLPEILRYIVHFSSTLYSIFKDKERYDLYIGADPLNALVGILLKRIKRIECTVLYTVDYTPQKFNNCMLNRLYHYIDTYCVKKSDYIWNLSSRMVRLRERKGVSKEYRHKQLTVPIGTDLIVEPLPFNKVNRYELGFIGHLREGHGLGLLIESFADVVKKIPKAKIIIIGKGKLKSYLREKAKSLQVSPNINFLGYVENHRKALKRLSVCIAGLAPYEDNEFTFTRYADPGKPKVYLSVGLPIIITNVPAISKKIKETECGIVIDYDKAQLTKSIMDILTKDDLAKKLRTNAIKLRDSFSWERVFKDALKKTLKI